MLLHDMGKAGLAIMVLGVAACSEDGAEEPTTTDSTGAEEPSTTTDSAGEPSTTPVSSADASTTTSTQAVSSSGWQRANLGFVSAYILYRNGMAALVDTGVTNSERQILAALGEIGLGWDSVGHVIVTHNHPDHQGSLQGVMVETADAPWYAGAGDIGTINATSKGNVVGDGDLVFDLEIIETPGHTPGHISVLDRVSGVLVTGDALNGAGGGVAGANEQFSQDMDLANASVGKLAGFDYDVALFGHGDPILNEASRAVGALAESLG